MGHSGRPEYFRFLCVSINRTFCILHDWCINGDISRNFEKVFINNFFFAFFLLPSVSEELLPWHMPFASAVSAYPYLWLHHASYSKFLCLSMEFLNKNSY